MTQNLSKDLLKALSDIVGASYITDDPVTRFTYTQDASLFGGTQSALVVRPGSTDEVSRIAALATGIACPLSRAAAAPLFTASPRAIRTAPCCWT